MKRTKCPLSAMEPVRARPGALADGCVLFDLDGTLVDTAPDLADALNKVLWHHGEARITSLDVADMIGDGLYELLKCTFARCRTPIPPERLPAEFARFRQIYRSSPARLSRPYPGMVDVIEHLASRGARLAVCTNKDEPIADSILVALGLRPYFGALVGGTASRPKKPDPAPLTLAIRKLKGRRDRTVMVGDSRADLAAGRAAGVGVVLVSHGYGREDVALLRPDHTAHDGASLLAAITGLLDRVCE